MANRQGGIVAAAVSLNPDEPVNPDNPVPGGRGGNAEHVVPPTGNQGIDGLLGGVAWNSNAITYSFPTAASLYGASLGTGPGQYPNPAPFNGFAPLTTRQQADVARAFSLISSYTRATFTPITEQASVHATIRFANSSFPPTAYAFYPSADITGGDVYFGQTGVDPVMGNFDSGNAVLHEIGHALGLKHGQDAETNGMVPANLLDNEYSLMNYPAYIGDVGSGSPIGTGSSPQTYMMYDIAALQYLYGANFGKTGVSQVYTWSPTTGEEFISGIGQGTPFNNHIFSTVWTAGATATYDLRNFAQNATLDPRPGGFLRFSDPQLADLGFTSPQGPGAHLAQGNVYNALLFNGDTRSEVSALLTGDGNDIVNGNDVFDTITLGAGSDTVNAGSGGGKYIAGSGADDFFGGASADYFDLGNFTTTERVDGGGGSNVAIFAGKQADYTDGFNNGTITVTVKTTPSAIATLTNVQTLQFSDAVVPAASLPCFVSGTRIATPNGTQAVETLREGDLVIIRSGETLPVIWLGHRQVTCIDHPRPWSVWPVLVTAHAFGPGMPVRDLLLSPNHCVFFADVLIPVKYLINASTIRQLPRRVVSYNHVELPRHEVILAEGLPVETYLDVGDRANFANGGRVAAFYPEFVIRRWEAAGCAPLVICGPQLAAARRSVNALAADTPCVTVAA
jgi:serralysin